MIHPLIKSSFDILLKLHEVTNFSKFVMMFADTWTEIPGGENEAGFRDGAVGPVVLRGGR